jgi:hypothetical protein
VCVDRHHFVVLGDDFMKRRLATVYKIGDEDLRGDGLSEVPCSVKWIAVYLSSMEFGVWEEDQRSKHEFDGCVMGSGS